MVVFGIVAMICVGAFFLGVKLESIRWRDQISGICEDLRRAEALSSEILEAYQEALLAYKELHDDNERLRREIENRKD